MARQFNGTDQSLQSAATLDGTSVNKIAVQIWLWRNNFSATYTIAETSALSDNNAGSIGIFSDAGTDFIQCVGNVGVTSGTIGQPSANAWHHYVYDFDFTQDNATALEIPHIWRDGTEASITPVNQSNNNTGNFGNYTLNLMSRNNSSLWLPGRMAEVAIWAGINLTQDDVDDLWNGGAGVDARTVQNGNLTFYWQLCGAASPETALVGGTSLTVNGATSAAHPISGTGICSGGTLITPSGASLACSFVAGSLVRGSILTPQTP